MEGYRNQPSTRGVDRQCRSFESAPLRMEEKPELYVEIANGGKGQCCDLYPAGGLFPVKRTDKGLQVLNRSAHWIPPFPIIEYKEKPAVKACPKCQIEFTLSTPFVDSQQKGDEPLCFHCYRKKYLPGDGYALIEAIRKQVLKELTQYGWIGPEATVFTKSDLKEKG